MDKKTHGGIILLSVVAILISIFLPAINYARWENKKTLCNKMANYIPFLQESYETYNYSYGKEETLESLKEKIDFALAVNAQTNKEVNRLNKILSCYFDK